MNTAKEKLISLLSDTSGLLEVEKRITAKFASDVELLSQISEYLLHLGGKRIRPLLCLLIWRAFSADKPSDKLLDTAAGIELIHMATLLHDDIIDNSPLRRSKESPYKKFGSSNTLLAGDFLLVRAFSLCSRLDRYIIDATETACIELTEGEILETLYPLENYSVNDSLEIAKKKTASLFKLASEASAYLLGFNTEAIANMRMFGESLGVAFQILDDILDVTADEDILGKKTGTDIREKKPSVVNLLWLKSESVLAKTVLLTQSPLAESQITLSLEELRKSEVIQEAKKLAKNLIASAKSNLYKAKDIFTGLNSEVKTHIPQLHELEIILEYTLNRLG